MILLTVNVTVVSIGVHERVHVASEFPSRFLGKRFDRAWSIGTSHGRKVRLAFSEFRTTDKSGFLRAGYGNDSSDFRNAFFVWSGHSLPPDLISEENEMWLRFTSASLAAGSGFELTASTVPFNGKQARFFFVFPDGVVDFLYRL